VYRCLDTQRQLRSARQYSALPVLQPLLTSFVEFGLPTVQLRRFDSMQNASAAVRLILNHVTDALICSHWLRISERVRLDVAVLTCRALRDSESS
jgi:hypothetical protein